MKILSISEAKATLSEQLRHVRSGEEIVITERGKPIARLVPAGPTDGEADLEELEQSGLVRRGSGELTETFWKMPRPADKNGSVRAAVIEEREGNW